MWFQALFHSPPRGAFHLSLTVLVHYRSHGSLSPWRVVPPASRPISRVGRYSGTPLRNASECRLPGCHRLWRPVPGDFVYHRIARPWVLQPRHSEECRFGLRPVRSPLLGASQLIPLPPGTEMFQFPGFASLRRVMTALARRRVSPFGHLGLTGCVRLPRAFRSLPRPSSPPCAQASPTCLRSLDHIVSLDGDQAEHALTEPADPTGLSKNDMQSHFISSHQQRRRERRTACGAR